MGPSRDNTLLLVFGLLGVVVLGAVSVAYAISRPPKSELIAAQPSQQKSQPVPKNHTGQSSHQLGGDAEANAASRRAEYERREAERVGSVVPIPISQLKAEEEVVRQLEDNRKARAIRLEALAERERRELAPIEAEIEEIQLKIDSGDKNMAKLREQVQSVPQSAGIPEGTRFQPGISRETRDFAARGVDRWQKLQAEFARLRAELVGSLRVAEQRLEQKRDSFDRERRTILADE